VTARPATPEQTVKTATTAPTSHAITAPPVFPESQVGAATAFPTGFGELMGRACGDGFGSRDRKTVYYGCICLPLSKITPCLAVSGAKLNLFEEALHWLIASDV